MRIKKQPLIISLFLTVSLFLLSPQPTEPAPAADSAATTGTAPQSNIPPPTTDTPPPPEPPTAAETTGPITESPAASTPLLIHQPLPWYGRFRAGFGGGLTVPYGDNLAASFNFDKISSFSLHSGYNISPFIDFNPYIGILTGIRYRYGHFFSPDPVLEGACYHAPSLYAGYAFHLGGGTFKLSLGGGPSFFTLTDVRDNLLSLLNTTGSDRQYQLGFIEFNARAVGDISRYVDIFAEIGVEIHFAREPLPLFSFNLGVLLPFDSFFVSETEPSPEIIEVIREIEIVKEVEVIKVVELYPREEVLVAQLHFYTNTNIPIFINLQSIVGVLPKYLERYPDKRLTARLVGYAVPWPGDYPTTKLQQDRADFVKKLMIELGYTAELIEAQRADIDLRQDIDRTDRPYHRRVDIFLTVSD